VKSLNLLISRENGVMPTPNF